MSTLHGTPLKIHPKAEFLLTNFARSWNEKKADKMVSLFSEDAEFTDIMGQIARGKNQIEQMHHFVFQNFMQYATLTLNPLYVREIGENRRMATCQWKTVGHTDPKGNQLPSRTGIMVVVVTTEADEWLISLIQNFDFTSMYNNSEQYKMVLFEEN